jgi:hypothetical protein
MSMRLLDLLSLSLSLYLSLYLYLLSSPALECIFGDIPFSRR